MSEAISEDHDASIIVNGQRKSVESRDVTWAEVVDIAFPGKRSDPDFTFVVTFTDASQRPDNGLLAEGGTVRVEKDDTVFNVVDRRRS